MPEGPSSPFLSITPLPLLIIALITTLCFLLWHGAAEAQAFLSLTRPMMNVVLGYELEDEERIDRNGKRSIRDDRISARLELNTRGWVYHPEFCQFLIDLRPEWDQQDTSTTPGFDRDTQLTYLGYRVDATLLRAKPYSMRFLASQTRSDFSSSLSLDTDTEVTLARGELRLRMLEAAPMRLVYENRRISAVSLTTSVTTGDLLEFVAEHETGISRTDVRSQFLAQDYRTDSTGSHVDRLDASLTNRYRFRPRASLLSRLWAYTILSGPADTESYNLSERLELFHRPNLRTDYRLQLAKLVRNGFETENVGIGAGARHSLYENLTSSLALQLREENTTQGEDAFYEGNLAFDYQRRIPVGRIEAFAGLRYLVEDSQIIADTSQVIDEPHVLSGTSPSFLERSNADPSSIVVTDQTGTVVYQESFDYVVVLVGTSAGIARTLLGNIPDGDQVLVDYEFIPRAPFKTARTESRLGLALDLWNVVNLGYIVTRTEEDLIAGTRPSDLVDDRIQRARAELRWRWLSTLLEYEDRDTILVPQTRRRAYQSLTPRLSSRLSLFADIGYETVDFEDTGDKLENLRATARLRWRMIRWANLELGGSARRASGTTQDSEQFAVGARLTWWFGAWGGDVVYRFLSQRDSITLLERDSQRIRFEIRRRF